MAPGHSRSRRRLLGQIGLAAITAGCEAAPVPLPLSAPGFAAPRRLRGNARISVSEHGARGDGIVDDTAAFQEAIDALPTDGGTIHVPPGKYLIDPVRSVRLRSRMHLDLAEQATLVAKPNAAERSCVLCVRQVHDTEISGGRIVGDRKRHLGETGEWGHGVEIQAASRITLRDLHVSDCWGDGAYVGATWSAGRERILSDDVVIARVVSTGNRRQGLSITGSQNVRVHDCEFSNTSGTAPECGIDIEPNAPDVTSGVHIENCLLKDNASNGIQVYKRSRDVVIRDCLIEHNGGYGILAIGASGGTVLQNRIRHNRLQGLGLRGGTSDYRVSQNRFRNNNTRNVHLNDLANPEWESVEGREGIRPHVDIDDASDIVLATNFYAE